MTQTTWRGKPISELTSGELTEMLGIIDDLLTCQLHDPILEFSHIDAQGRLIAKVQGMEMKGKPVSITLRPDQIRGIGAE